MLQSCRKRKLIAGQGLCSKQLMILRLRNLSLIQFAEHCRLEKETDEATTTSSFVEYLPYMDTLTYNCSNNEPYTLSCNDPGKNLQLKC